MDLLGALENCEKRI